MTKPRDSTATAPGRDSYEVRLAVRLDATWATQFDGFSLTHDEDGTTVLTGQSVDQAALHGVLQRVRDLGLPLAAVTSLARSDPPTADQSTSSTEGDS